MKLSVIGCGYLGAVHAASMAKLGHEVVGVDVDSLKVERLSRGQAPFFEPGLPEILAESLASGRLTFTTDMSDVRDALVHFIAVGTPQQNDSNAADLTYVENAIDGLLPNLKADHLVVGKSTVPVGTAARLASLVAETGATLAWNPEFLREGFAIRDTLSPDRIVYGVSQDTAGQRATLILDEVYFDALNAGTPRIVTDLATSELVKVAANAFLASKISFINAMAEIAEAAGADVTQLADAIGYDERIGRRFLGAGIGFGGGCLPKDLRAFVARAEELGKGSSVAFLKEVDSINMRRRDKAVSLIVHGLKKAGREISDSRVAILGASFKPHSDDVRDSPALDVATRLHHLGAEVVVTDPQALENAGRAFPQVTFEASRDEALQGAHAVLIATEWDEYRRELTPELTASLTAGRLIVDGRNCLDPKVWRDAGWTYHGMGRP